MIEQREQQIPQQVILRSPIAMYNPNAGSSRIELSSPHTSWMSSMEFSCIRGSAITRTTDLMCDRIHSHTHRLELSSVSRQVACLGDAQGSSWASDQEKQYWVVAPEGLGGYLITRTVHVLESVSIEVLEKAGLSV